MGIVPSVLILISLISPPGPAWAQPGRDRLLNVVAIDEDTGCAVVTIEFNIPIRYVDHFPLKSGKELRIRLRALAVSPFDRPALSRREAALPPPNEFAALTEVIYEGDIPVGPYLTLRFRRPVTYTVGQGADYRSLRVAIVGPEPAARCLPHG